MADGLNSKDEALATPGIAFSMRKRLRVILQTEAAECGLACLAMIVNHYGHDLDLAAIRQRFRISIKGTTLGRLIEIADKLGFASRPLRVEPEDLFRLRMPCILHWDLKHFVVLKSVSKGMLTIHDPARGAVRCSAVEAMEHFTGVVLELSPLMNFSPVADRRRVSIGSIIGKISGLNGALFQILGLAIALEAFTLAGPFYLQWIIDHVLVSSDFGTLNLLGAGFSLLIVFAAIIGAVRSWSMTRLSTTLDVEWSGNLFRHLMKLPLEWYERRHVGDIVSRFGSIQTIQRTLSTEFISALLDGVMSIATLAIMFVYCSSIAIVAVMLLLLYAALRVAFFKPLRDANENRLVYSAVQQSELLESIRGIMPIKLAGKDGERSFRYLNAVVAATNSKIHIQKLSIAYTFALQVIFGLGRVIMIWIATIATLNNKLMPGAMIAFIAYSDQFIARSGAFVDRLAEFMMLRLHAERVSEIAFAPPEPEGGAEFITFRENKSLELLNVSFRYAESEPWVLKNCTLKIAEGESVAITGPSGCGKSTLAKLMLGLLNPTEGEVRYGGIDIKKMGIRSFRRVVGAVMQNDHLFAGSLADNISFFDPEMNLEEVENAARRAGIHDEITSLPMHYHSLVGDMGSALSGGQKQRIILARAIYRKPNLLILDEATSHLDIPRERAINDEIKKINATSVLFAHREETILSADRVIDLPTLNSAALVPATV